MRISVSAAISIIVASLSFATPVHADGISSLIIVSQQRSDNANDAALERAERQRELVNRQRELREAQREVDDLSNEYAERRSAAEDAEFQRFGAWLTGGDPQRESSQQQRLRAPQITICRICVAQTAPDSDDDDD